MSGCFSALMVPVQGRCPGNTATLVGTRHLWALHTLWVINFHKRNVIPIWALTFYAPAPMWHFMFLHSTDLWILVTQTVKASWHDFLHQVELKDWTSKRYCRVKTCFSKSVNNMQNFFDAPIIINQLQWVIWMNFSSLPPCFLWYNIKYAQIWLHM